MSNPNVPHPYHPHHPLVGCQLKMTRAQEHLHTLYDAIDNFTGRNPYEVVNDFQPEVSYYVNRFKVREWPPLYWSPLVGDIVHNMRSTLDHLAWQLVLRGKGKPSRRTAFPILTRSPFDPSVYRTPDDAKDALGRWDAQIKGMHPNDVAVIKLLQPYQRGKEAKSDWLARLSELSNRDKHREFHFAAQSLMEYEFSVKETTNNVSPRPVYFKPKGEILKDDEVIARFWPLVTGPDPKLDMKLKLLFDIAFGEGSPLEGLAIKQTLPALFNHVMTIVLKFKERFDLQDFSPPSLQ